MEWLRALAKGDLTWRIGAAGEREQSEVAALLEQVQLQWSRERQRSLEQTAGAIAQVTEVYERERKLLEVIADGLLVADADGRVLRINETMLGWLGRDSSEVVTHHVSELLAGESGWLESLIESSVARDIALDLQGRDEVIPMNVTGSVTRDHRNRVREIVLLARDVREARRADEVRRQLIHADRLALLGTMAASVAHEINNPACFVLANLQYSRTLLATLQQSFDSVRSALPSGEREAFERSRGAAVDDALSEMLDMAQDNAQGIERISRIVRDLRSFSRSDQGRPEELDPNEEIEAAINMVANRISHRAQLVRNLAPLPRVTAQQGQLAQVVMNLLVNAADAIEDAGQGDHTITVSTRVDGDWMVVEVQDTGNGIPAEIHDRIFEQFFTTKPVNRGTGLGLSLCADIAHNHGGTLDFDSQPGRGTRFELRLPTDESRSKKARGGNGGRERSSSAAGPGSGGGRILLVDDEPLVLKSMRRTLSPPHEVVCVRDGKQAIEAIEQGPEFDVILCDMMMPGVDGVDVYEYLRDHAPAQVARMVFCTGGVFTKRVEDLLESTPNLVASKPLDYETLRALVERVRNGDQDAARLDSSRV